MKYSAKNLHSPANVPVWTYNFITSAEKKTQTQQVYSFAKMQPLSPETTIMILHSCLQYYNLPNDWQALAKQRLSCVVGKGAWKSTRQEPT